MGRKVLVIDDEPRVRELLRRLLVKLLPDAAVESAICGCDGLELATADPPDLIILDVILPDMDGLQVCQELRARGATPRVPILMISGILTDVEARADALQAGADGFLCKPFESVEFMALVTALLRIRDYDVQMQREGEARYRKLFDLIDDAVMLFDAQTLQFIDVNPAAERMYGYSREEFLRLHHSDITAESTASWQSFKLTHEMGTCSIPLRWHRRSDDSAFPVSISGCEITLDGRPVMCGIVRDISEQRRAERELERSHREVRKLAAESRRAREDESRRVSREIHDELGQALTGLKMDISWLMKHEERLSAGSRNRLIGMDGLIETTVNAVRRICTELRPGALDDLGLVPAVESLAKTFSQRTGITCHLRLDNNLRPLNDDAVTALFRIAQEALTNVARHAEASAVDISLESEGEEVTLCIHDDGRGMDTELASHSGTLGLRVMRERVLDVEGRLEILSSADKGTTIKVSVPALGAEGNGT